MGVESSEPPTCLKKGVGKAAFTRYPHDIRSYSYVVSSTGQIIDHPTEGSHKLDRTKSRGRPCELETSGLNPFDYFRVITSKINTATNEQVLRRKGFTLQFYLHCSIFRQQGP